jgi:signal peptidase
MSTPRRHPVRWTVGLLAPIVLLFLFAPTTVGGVTSYVIVSGSSMEPTFSEGDLVVVREGSYEIGDVVAFETAMGW